jgi:hypothetical protein
VDISRDLTLKWAEVAAASAMLIGGYESGSWRRAGRRLRLAAVMSSGSLRACLMAAPPLNIADDTLPDLDGEAAAPPAASGVTGAAGRLSVPLTASSTLVNTSL